MLTRFLAFLAPLFLLLLPSPAMAWWEYGHESVATVAWLEMKPETVPEICAKYGLWHPMLEMAAA